MTKYTRSLQKLSAAIEDILQTPGISLDTKAIVLLLAATMPPTAFIGFLTPIEKLAAIRNQLLLVNDLRTKCGNMFRDYIIIAAFKTAKHQISSDEMQQFISEIGRDRLDATALKPALEAVHLDSTFQAAHSALEVADTEKFLVQKLKQSGSNYATAVLDTYLYCRTKATALNSYNSVMRAIIAVLSANGLGVTQAEEYSKKLLRYVLSPFVQQDNSQHAILHKFNSLENS